MKRITVVMLVLCSIGCWMINSSSEKLPNFKQENLVFEDIKESEVDSNADKLTTPPPIHQSTQKFKNDAKDDYESNVSQVWSLVFIRDKFVVLMSDDRIFATSVASITTLHAFILYVMGQPIFSKSGKIKLWVGDINSPENSQQFTDWYTFSHILHGFIFYGIGSMASSCSCLNLNLGVKEIFIIAMLAECFWEILENSPIIINRYRQSALAAGYTGDSVFNSVSDVLAMSLGFWISHNLPPMVILGLAVTSEIIMLIAIRDNLTLNIIQLIHPSEAISKWQSAGASKEKPKEENDTIPKSDDK